MKLSSQNNNAINFDYMWIIRCSGSRINSNIEYRLLPEAPDQNITPLIEVINQDISTPFRNSLRRKYHRVFVEYPAYLKEQGNKFRAKPDTTLTNYHNCIDFFNSISLGPDVPVISAYHDPRDIVIDYSIESRLLEEIIGETSEVAVRARIPTENLD